MKNVLSSETQKQEQAMQLTSLIGDFLIDPKDADIYETLKKKGTKEDIQMIGQLRKGQQRISTYTGKKIGETLQDDGKKQDDFDAMLDEENLDKMSAIRELYNDPEVRKIFFQEYANRKDTLDLIKKGYTQLSKVQKIDNDISKAKNKILQIRIASFAKNKPLSPSEIMYIKKIQESIYQKQEEKDAMLQVREIATAYRHWTLVTYKKQLDTKGFVMTPSRQKIVDEIIEKVLLGQNVLLTGPTGTGKTVLAIEAVKAIAVKMHIGLETIQGKALAQEIINNPNAEQMLNEFVVVLSGHAGITPAEFIAKMGLKGDGKGGTQTTTQLGKVLKAFVDGNIPIIDEIDLIPNDVLMRIKHLFTLRSGMSYAPQEDGDNIYKLLTTTVIATANIKSAKHTDRQELDPAIVRLLPGVEVKYLPEEETYDLALSNCIEPKGFAYGVDKTSLSSKEGVLYHLIVALKEIEDNYLGKGEGITISGKSNMRLQKAILELGNFVGLFKGFKESGQDFVEFMKTKIIKFVSNGAYPKTDRLLLINIFAEKGLITKQEIPLLLERMSDISQKELDENIFSDTYQFPEDDMKFVDPYELANFDPYAMRNLETLELADKNILIKNKIKQLSADLLALQDTKAEQLLDIFDNILDSYEKNHEYELPKQQIHLILGGLYELGLADKLVECADLGISRQKGIESLMLFDHQEGTGILKNQIPQATQKQSPTPSKETKEKATSTLPGAVAKQQQDAIDYFTTNNETNHLEIVIYIKELIQQKKISYVDTGNGTYTVNFNLPGCNMQRYMPEDETIGDSQCNYTLRDESKLPKNETTKAKLQSTEGKKYLKEKEQKENKRLFSKAEILKLGKALLPNRSEEEQILAIMQATGFYGWMRLSDSTNDYQLAVDCYRESGDREFDEMDSGTYECSLVYTAAV